MSHQTPPSPDQDATDRHRPRRRPRLLGNILLWLMIGLLMVVAGLTTWARYTAENIDQYRPQLEAMLSERLGQQVSIAGLSASWQGPDPVLRVEGLTIAHATRPEHNAIALQQLLLRLDGPRSLLRLGLVFERVEASGLDLVVAKGGGERIVVEGLDLPESGPGLAEVPELSSEQWLEPHRWLNELTRRISDPHIRLTHVTVGLRAPEAETVFVDIPQLNLAYHNNQMSASGRAMRQGTLDQLATFSVRGQDLFEGQFSGRIWAEITPGGFFESLTRGLQWRNFELEELNASASTWLTFEQGRLQRFSGRVDVARLLVHNHLGAMAPVENLSAWIGWRRTREGGSFHVRELGWQWQEDRVADLAARVDYDRLQFRIQSARLPLGPLARLAVASELLPARVQYHIVGLGPEGSLSSLHMEVPRKHPKESHLAATLDGIAFQPHQGAPGAANLQGQLWLNRHGGRVQVGGENMTLNFPKLFAAPWTFRQAAGEVGWRLDGGITRVFAQGLQVTYGEEASAEGAFDLRLDRYGEDNLGLKVSLRAGNADMLPAFVPVGTVSPDLYEWLTTAIRGGEISRGEFYGHGEIGKGATGFSTAMAFEFRNGQIAYDSHWPEVTGARGTVLIHNDNARIILDEATTAGLALEQGEVEVIAGEEAPVIRVATSTRINGDQVGFWLTETPLGDMAGGARQALSVSGDYDVSLSLTIPLASDHEVGIDVSLSTGNGSLYYPAADLRWDDIRGSLHYRTGSGFSDKPLSARFLNQTVSVRLNGDLGQGSLTFIQSGETDVQTLASRLMPDRQELIGIEGRLPYTATLEFPPQLPPRLIVDASGAGLWSEWPAPLSREAGPEERIEVMVRWPDDDHLQVEGHWGERLALALEWRQQAFHGGQVNLGNGKAYFSESAGLVVRVDVDSFAPAQWWPWLEQYSVTPGGVDAAAIQGSRDIDFDWLNRIELELGTLALGRHTVPGVTAIVRPDADGWLITADSDRAAGRVQVPASGGRIWVDLDHLRLARSDGDSGQIPTEPALLPPGEQLASFRNLDTGQWPEVDVRIGSLWLGDDPAGAWSFLLSPSPEQVTLQDLQGTFGELAFDGQLRWGVTSGEQATMLQGVLEGGGLQGLANLFGEDVPLDNERSVIDLGIGWPGRPDQFDAGRLNGEFSLRLDDGVILENNETAQLFRFFNLLNTDTLQRRLSFDFSDLYEAGVAFDAISGKATLDHGLLKWDPDIQLAGPSGALRLSGISNLADQTLDMRLVVVLPLTQNLPLAAILMGASPPVGGALFVLDKLLGEPLSKLTSATYSVGGTWDNPEVNLRNIFDSGNQK